MQVLQKLYDEAAEHLVNIFNFRLANKKAFSYSGKKRCSIAVDYTQVKNIREEKSILAEELVHCTKGYFYEITNLSNPLHYQNIHKCETLTAREAVKKLVPLALLQEGLQKQLTYDEIAEDLNVDECDVKEAIKIYRMESKLPMW